MTNVPDDEAILLHEDPAVGECKTQEPAEERPSRFFLLAGILRLWGVVMSWLRGPEEDPGEALAERDAEAKAAARMRAGTEGAWMEPYLGPGVHQDDLVRDVSYLIKHHRDELVAGVQTAARRRVEAAEARASALEALTPERVRDHVRSLESDCANLRRRVDELVNDKVIMATREQAARDSVRCSGEQLSAAERAAAEAKAQLIRSSADWQTQTDALDVAFLQAPGNIFVDARTPVQKVLALVVEVNRLRTLSAERWTQVCQLDAECAKLSKQLQRAKAKTKSRR